MQILHSLALMNMIKQIWHHLQKKKIFNMACITVHQFVSFK